MERKAELITNSARRMSKAMEFEIRDKLWWEFMRRETWILLKLAVKMFFKVRR